MTDNDTFKRADAGIELDKQDATVHERRLIDELHDIIVEEWGYSMRKDIDYIKSASNNSTVLIQMDFDDWSGTLLGGYPAALLKYGWAITGWKSNTIFVSKITETAEEDVAYRFQGDVDEINPIYSPQPCDACGERERVELVYSRAENGNEGFFGLCWECELPDGIEETEMEAPAQESK